MLKILKSLHLSYIAYVVLIVLFIYGVNSVGSGTIDRQEESLYNAIEKDIVHCYAVEGFYPPSLDFMKEHYGLTYDEKTFYVDYAPIGGNIHPDVTILRINE